MSASLCRAFLKKPFLNPWNDSHDPSLGPEEINIIAKLHRGEELVQDRHYFGPKDTHVVSWYWSEFPAYPRQWDGPVSLLMSRGIIRSVRCAGGYMTMILTDAAKKVCPKTLGRGALAGSKAT